MSSPSVKPSDIKIIFNLETPKILCYLCKKLSDKCIEEVSRTNEKIYFCSSKCFEEYAANLRNRRQSKEYSLTPHPKVMMEAMLKLKKEEKEK